VGAKACHSLTWSLTAYFLTLPKPEVQFLPIYVAAFMIPYILFSEPQRREAKDSLKIIEEYKKTGKIKIKRKRWVEKEITITTTRGQWVEEEIEVK
jgi:preprotein translocase subunit YajC